MRRLSVLFALALSPHLAWAAEIKVAENPVPANGYARVTLAGTEKGDNVAWDVTPEPTQIDDLGDGRLFFSGPAGTKYRVTADVVNFETKSRKKYRLDVTITGIAPQPPPPIDPKVDPPKPVDPPAAEVPIPGDGLRVMLVFDRLKLATMTEEQKAVVYGRDVRDYLRAKCPKGADGVTPEARFWPGDTDAGAESKLWQDAFSRAKSKAGTEPLWLIISNGKTGFEGKPPATVADMLALLKKYGG